MEPQMIELIDDAIKIGFGLVVGAFVSVVTLYATHRSAITQKQLEQTNALNKLLFERRTKFLSDCADNCEANFLALVECFSFVKTLTPLERSSPTTAQADKYKTLLNGMTKHAFASSKSQSQLLLLGETECNEAFVKFEVAVNATKGLFNLNSTDKELADAEIVFLNVAATRNRFYEAMRKAIKRLD